MPEQIHNQHNQHQLSDGDRNSTTHNFEELFDTARNLWEEGDLRKSWRVYEHICSLLKADPAV
jgi:hypothetical protein